MTVFELALSYVEARGGRRDDASPDRFMPKALRVVVNEASGDVTLTSRR